LHLSSVWPPQRHEMCRYLPTFYVTVLTEAFRVGVDRSVEMHYVLPRCGIPPSGKP